LCASRGFGNCDGTLYGCAGSTYKGGMTHSSGLTHEQIEEYLYRSYTRVDGLWFVLAEERHGFEEALALDEAVWKVMPKIQARLLQQQLGVSLGIPGLERALVAKLVLDRYQFSVERDGGGLRLGLSRCPWHDLILRSGRGHIAERIGGVICGVEFPGFAREFGCSCSAPPDERLCRNGGSCCFRFSPLSEPVER